jgi:hypothetical protein
MKLTKGKITKLLSKKKQTKKVLIKINTEIIQKHLEEQDLLILAIEL